jgi:hypothetical protein
VRSGASRDLTGELARRPVTERSVSTTLIIFLSPDFDQELCLLQIYEPVSVRPFTTERALKLSTKALSVGFPGPENSILALCR